MSLKQNARTSKQRKQNRKTKCKRCKTYRRCNTRGRMRGGGCGCANNFTLFDKKMGGSAGLTELSKSSYYPMNRMNNDPFGAQISERGFMGGKRNRPQTRGRKKLKGGTLNATQIMNNFGDSVGTPYYTGVLTGSPYIDPSVTNHPMDTKYSATNPYLV